MFTEPVYVFAKWQVKPEQLEMVLKLLKEVIKKSREEKGNLFYKLHQSTGDSNTLVLFEEYVDEAAVEAHRNSDHFQKIVIQTIIPLLENREVIVTKSISNESGVEQS